MKNLKILTGTFLITLLLTANSLSVNAAQETNAFTSKSSGITCEATIPPFDFQIIQASKILIREIIKQIERCEVMSNMTVEERINYWEVAQELTAAYMEKLRIKVGNDAEELQEIEKIIESLKKRKKTIWQIVKLRLCN